MASTTSGWLRLSQQWFFRWRNQLKSVLSEFSFAAWQQKLKSLKTTWTRFSNHQPTHRSIFQAKTVTFCCAENFYLCFSLKFSCLRDIHISEKWFHKSQRFFVTHRLKMRENFSNVSTCVGGRAGDRRGVNLSCTPPACSVSHWTPSNPWTRLPA